MTSVENKINEFLLNIYSAYNVWAKYSQMSEVDDIMLNMWLYYELKFILKLNVELKFGAVTLSETSDQVSESDEYFTSYEENSDSAEKNIDSGRIKDLNKKNNKILESITVDDDDQSSIIEDKYLISRSWLVVNGKIVDLFTRISKNKFYPPRIDTISDDKKLRNKFNPEVYKVISSVEYVQDRIIKQFCKKTYGLGKTSKRKHVSNMLFEYSLRNFDFQQLAWEFRKLTNILSKYIANN